MASLVNNNSPLIAEWAGSQLKNDCFVGVTLGTGMGSGPASVVVSYLQSPVKMRGLTELVKEFGEGAVNSALGKDKDQVLVPYKVERFLQTPLTQVFQDEMTLASFGDATKVAEVTTLFLKVNGFSLRILGSLSTRVMFDETSWAALEEDHGDVQERGNQWIVKLNDCVGIGSDAETQNSLVPKDAEIPSVVDHIYALFTRGPATPFDPAPVATRCKESGQDGQNMNVDLIEPEEPGQKSEIVAGISFSGYGGAAVQWKFPADAPSPNPTTKA